MTVPEYDALVVGCGFGGMGAAIQLRRLGMANILMVVSRRGFGWHLACEHLSRFGGGYCLANLFLFF